MVLIGLILIALVSLALGLVLASAPWLIVSLVASVVAAFWLWRRRDDIAPATAGTGGGGRRPAKEAAVPEVAESRATVASRAGEAPVAQPGDVWVVDGKPDYHLAGCSHLTGDAEPVPHEQAVADGFTPCATCEPEAARSPAAVPAGAPAEVWVVDGRPEYHLPGCGELSGEAEAIPLAQAVEDGFRPCVVCEPDRAGERVAASIPEGELTEVWVVDGRPDYHLPGCEELTEAAEVIPYQQAVQDGFSPCASCDPQRLRHEAEPVAVAEPAAVAEPEPEPEPEPVAEPQPEPEGVAEAEPVAEAQPVAEAEPEPEPEPPAIAVSEPEPIAVAEPEPEGHADVWVVAGRQRYHSADCVIITGQDAVAIPYEQAVGDGFKPCSLCEPA